MRKAGSGRAWAGEEPLIMASRSVARQTLLSGCGIEAELRPADLDERGLEAEEAARGALPAIVARRLAGEKARSVSLQAPRRFVLGADQVLAFEDRCWAKAADRNEAASRLARLSGRSHQLISACAIAREGLLLYEGLEIAEMHMRDLSQDEIRSYLDIVGDQALASVGAYQIEGVGRLLFDQVDADHAAILGLPLGGLLGYLRSAALIRP
jgi:septum formation protein